MPRKPKWLPRASSLGYYMSCSYRAAFDRALHEGVLDLPRRFAAPAGVAVLVDLCRNLTYGRRRGADPPGSAGVHARTDRACQWVSA